MKQDNFISFSIVFGFFVGLIISLVKFSSPELIVFWTIICTTCVYLITTFCVSLYIMFIDYNHTKINKDKLESTFSYYLSELDRKEKEVLGVRKYLKASLKSINDEQKE